MNRRRGATKAKVRQKNWKIIFKKMLIIVLFSLVNTVLTAFTRLTFIVCNAIYCLYKSTKKILILEHSPYSPSLAGCEKDSVGPSQRVQNLKKEVEQLYQNNVPHGKKFETEVFEMKRQLWLSACRRDNRNDTTYGRAFVAPVLPGRNNSRYGNTDDMRNLLEDIYDI